MKHFFPGIIAQDIRKAKSENIELFKNALNKLLNIKNHFIITHMRTLLHAFRNNAQIHFCYTLYIANYCRNCGD